MKKYGIYKKRFIIDGEFQPDTTLNGFYDLSFFLAYPEYQLPTLTIKDGEQLIPKNKLLTEYELLIAEYDENILSPEIITQYIANVPPEFNLSLLTKEQAVEWVRANTTLQELEPNLFEISPETTSTMPGMEGVVPQVVLDLR